MTFLDAAPEPAARVLRKGGLTVAVCIPARNEAATITPIVESVRDLRRLGVVDDLVVIDDASTDETASLARMAGATVVASSAGPGKGQALTVAVAATDADVLVFLDADVSNFTSRFVTDLAAAVVADPGVQLAKAAYRRPCNGRADEGGRVTELLARPLLRRFFPSLADLAQPLSGECAVRRSALSGVDFATGYGIEIGLVIDVCRRFGRAAIAEVDLGERVHRNRPLQGLRSHTDDIVAAVFDRVPDIAPIGGEQP